MARFMGVVQGQRGEASRLGGASSGIRAQAQGWHVGVKVYGFAEGDSDEFRIFATSGSSGRASDAFVGIVRLVDGEPTFIPARESMSIGQRLAPVSA